MRVYSWTMVQGHVTVYFRISFQQPHTDFCTSVTHWWFLIIKHQLVSINTGRGYQCLCHIKPIIWLLKHFNKRLRDSEPCRLIAFLREGSFPRVTCYCNLYILCSSLISAVYCPLSSPGHGAVDNGMFSSKGHRSQYLYIHEHTYTHVHMHTHVVLCKYSYLSWIVVSFMLSYSVLFHWSKTLNLFLLFLA